MGIITFYRFRTLKKILLCFCAQETHRYHVSSVPLVLTNFLFQIFKNLKSLKRNHHSLQNLTRHSSTRECFLAD